MLKNLIQILTVFIFVSIPAHAEDKADPALWKLSDHNSEIYLFGTIHVMDPNIKWRSPKVVKALTETDILYLEVSLDDMAGEKAIKILSRYGHNKAGTSLFDLISPEAEKAVNLLLQKYHMPESFKQQLAPLRPWLAALTLLNIQMAAEKIDPASGVDQSLEREAKLFKKEIKYLETIEQQLSLFATMSPADDIRFFEDSVLQMNESPEMLSEMLELWAKGDTEGLVEFINYSFNQFPNLQKSFLYDRNKNWANQIDQMMQGSGDIFIAVGAGHLGGEKSVQWYLEQKGYEIIRLQ